MLAVSEGLRVALPLSDRRFTRPYLPVQEIDPQDPLFSSMGVARSEIEARSANPALRPRDYISEWGDPMQMPLVPLYPLPFRGFENGHRPDLVDAIRKTRENWGVNDKEQVSRHIWKLYINGRGTLISIINEELGSVETPYGNTLKESWYPVETMYNAISPHLVTALQAA